MTGYIKVKKDTYGRARTKYELKRFYNPKSKRNKLAMFGVPAALAALVPVGVDYAIEDEYKDRSEINYVLDQGTISDSTKQSIDVKFETTQALKKAYQDLDRQAYNASYGDRDVPHDLQYQYDAASSAYSSSRNLLFNYVINHPDMKEKSFEDYKKKWENYGLDENGYGYKYKGSFSYNPMDGLDPIRYEECKIQTSDTPARGIETYDDLSMKTCMNPDAEQPTSEEPDFLINMLSIFMAVFSIFIGGTAYERNKKKQRKNTFKPKPKRSDFNPRIN